MKLANIIVTDEALAQQTVAEAKAGADFATLATERSLDPKGKTVDVTKAPYGADPSGKKDATAAIQKALDAVGKQGGGVVFLPAGTYRLVPPKGKSSALFVRHSGVVLRGAGRGLTFLFNDETSMRNRAVLTLAPAGSSNWYGGGADTRKLSKNAANRATVKTRQPDDMPIAGLPLRDEK